MPRRKNNPEIFSVYDFNQWCIDHKYNENSLHSTFVPYYYINDLFVLFTTKQLFMHLCCLGHMSTLIQHWLTKKLDNDGLADIDSKLFSQRFPHNRMLNSIIR